MIRAGIIDPTKVVRHACRDAASVAGLLITTEAMVAEKPEPKMPPGGGYGRHGFLADPGLSKAACSAPNPGQAAFILDRPRVRLPQPCPDCSARQRRCLASRRRSSHTDGNATPVPRSRSCGGDRRASPVVRSPRLSRERRLSRAKITPSAA